ncbi:MAG: helix-turn-helix domain-containing protein [Rikenellaceae bacterium]|nr:helix-turn-helix domain-containing protein [Rikenellaceae bacterium]
MDNCFYGINSFKCDFFPDCQNKQIVEKRLDAGTPFLLIADGPCLVLFCNEGVRYVYDDEKGIDISSFNMVLFPRREFYIESSSQQKLIILDSDLLIWMAEGLNIDYTNRIRKPYISPDPFPLITNNVLSGQSLCQDLFHCRKYWEYKIRELSFFIRCSLPEKSVKKIKFILFSKNWLFKIKAMELIALGKTQEECAEILNYSLSGFSKHFKQVFGISFYRIFTAERLNRVINDLKHSNLSNRELTEKYNFYSVQHFGNFIKTHTGKTTRQLRTELIKSIK